MSLLANHSRRARRRTRSASRRSPSLPLQTIPSAQYQEQQNDRAPQMSTADHADGSCSTHSLSRRRFGPPSEARSSLAVGGALNHAGTQSSEQDNDLMAVRFQRITFVSRGSNDRQAIEHTAWVARAVQRDERHWRPAVRWRRCHIFAPGRELL